MARRLALALAVVVVALTLSAASLHAGEPTSLPEAQAQLRSALAQARQDRAEKAEKAEAARRAAAAQPRRAAELSCKPKAAVPAAETLTGALDLDTLSLENSRSAGVSLAIKETHEDKVVDGRCGSLRASLADSLSYEVTPRHYWGQDILQLPKSAAAASGKPFEAQLHTCQYDGDWHADWDAVLVCTLSPR